MGKLVDTNESCQIAKFEELFEALGKFRGEESPCDVYLRGHADETWLLVPSIGRRDFYCYGGSTIHSFTKEQELDLFHRFRRYAYAHLGRTLGAWEALFLARHHGLPVRLLDWTSNPLVALFNAVEDSKYWERDGAIWLLGKKQRRPDIDVLNQDIDPLKVKGVRMIYPSYVSQRLLVQDGFFTIHGYPWNDLRVMGTDDLASEDLDIERLKKLVVPRVRKKELLLRLMRASINARTLFPDLDGLAKGLWQLEAVRGLSEATGESQDDKES